jgi:membrane associated rhomboid family serine protease
VAVRAHLVAGLAYLAFAERPSVGASGAISGLMGYVLVAAPWVEVRVVIGIWFTYSRPYDLAAGWLLVPWILFQFVEGSIGDASDVAVSAHIGGFAAGAAGAALMRSRLAEGTPWYIDPRPPAGGRAAVDRLRRARAAGIADR